MKKHKLAVIIILAMNSFLCISTNGYEQQICSNESIDFQQPVSSNQSIQKQNFEKRVIELSNIERAKRGLAPLKEDPQLMKLARMKSQDMADKNYFSHTSPTYGEPHVMLNSFGVPYSSSGENIAMGQRTPEEVVQGWMNSSGHRANILNNNFTNIGVGVAEDPSGKILWTQIFTRP